MSLLHQDLPFAIVSEKIILTFRTWTKRASSAHPACFMLCVGQITSDWRPGPPADSRKCVSGCPFLQRPQVWSLRPPPSLLPPPADFPFASGAFLKRGPWLDRKSIHTVNRHWDVLPGFFHFAEEFTKQVSSDLNCKFIGCEVLQNYTI